MPEKTPEEVHSWIKGEIENLGLKVVKSEPPRQACLTREELGYCDGCKKEGKCDLEQDARRRFEIKKRFWFKKVPKIGA